MKKISIVLLAVAMLFAFASCANNSSIPEGWNIGVRVGQHKAGYSEDYGNWKFAEAELNGNIITVKADLESMNTYASSVSSQGSAKWLALLIDTGETDLTKVKYNGEALDSTAANEYKDLKAADDTDAKSSELVLWIKADDAAYSNGGRSIKFSKENAEDVFLTITVEDTTPDVFALHSDYDVIDGKVNKYQDVTVSDDGTVSGTIKYATANGFNNEEPAQNAGYYFCFDVNSEKVASVKSSLNGENAKPYTSNDGSNEFMFWLGSDAAKAKDVTLTITLEEETSTFKTVNFSGVTFEAKK